MIQVALRDGTINGIHFQREVRGQHSRGALFRRIVSARNSAGSGAVLGSPLVRASRTLREFPVITKKVFQEVVAPLHRSGGPCDLDTAGDGVVAAAGAIG